MPTTMICRGSMKPWSHQDEKIEANGINDLKNPLLQAPQDETVGTVTPQIKDIKGASYLRILESKVRSFNGINGIMASPTDERAATNHVPDFIVANKIKETIEDTCFGVDELKGQDISECRIKIKGMTCTSCSQSVEHALQMIDGVKKAVVGLALEEAKVLFDPNLVDTNKVIEAIEDAGFEADLINSRNDDMNKVHLKLEGVDSPEDVNVIISSLNSTVGVNHVDMDLTEHKVTINYDPDLTGPRSLIHCIKEASNFPNVYQATLYTPSGKREMDKVNEIRMYRNQVSFSCLFSVPVFILSMVLPMLPPYGNWLNYKIHNMLTLGLFLRWILSTPVQFIVGKRFYVGSYHALRRRSANMDVLVALGTSAAYFYSLYIVIKALASATFQGQDFFDTSSMLISFILLGKYLEIVAKGKTSAALEKLTQLVPDKAYLLAIDTDGNVLTEREIDTELIQKNDMIKIVPGAKIPVDGVVMKGKSYANESMITGEAKPVNKSPGDKVIGGTINENGCLLVKATHVGSDTALSQIVQLVEAAQLARAPVQKLADHISRVFVPIVVVASFITWLGWFIPGEAGFYPKSWIPEAMDAFEFALQFAISVLVVACPCALGLATPTAIMVASGVGASQGVLIKGGDAMEKAHKVKVVVFDKTGTLTIGKPVVVRAVLFSKISMEELCDMAIAVEANSEHPIAKAIVAHVKRLRRKFGACVEQVLEVKDFEVHLGAGVSGKANEKTVLVGNKRLMHACNVPISLEVERFISENEVLARTCVLVSIEGKISGGFSVTDPVKPEAQRVVSFLHSMNISTMIVTGDNWATANAVANEVGIDKVFAETDPPGKADIVKDLQMKGMSVAMVGDGINDSPSLAAADVGMAIGAGTDIAIEAADIVLVKSSLEDVITAIDLSRKTMSRIWLNYFWAFGYNILGLPIAAGVLYPFLRIRLPPWLAGACMAASSLSVVSSSLLLMLYKKPLHADTK
ncbi:copper-transporting ATPase HMA4-like [Lotus japonicus]|uniref:copper-transporting ATPase HMA4-like n=1 Tax=Lotus japonicus TaxID=34305 RepID=UPI0025869359|nr:copper-transporting ATPase HMA4-like [Lotus japonicus]